MEDVHTPRYIFYRNILPVFVFLGIVDSAICVLVLSRPRLRSQNVNRYFLVIAVGDLLACFAFIPMITTYGGCVYSSVAEAYTYIYLSWDVFNFSHSLVLYTIVWLSMDRFLAVWIPWTFRKIHDWPKFMWLRMVVTVLVLFVFHIIFVTQGSVTPKSAETDNVTSCSNGISSDVYSGFDYIKTNWHLAPVFIIFSAILLRWLPLILLLTVNAGLIIALLKGRVKLRGNTTTATSSSTVTTGLSPPTAVNNQTSPTTSVVPASVATASTPGSATDSRTQSNNTATTRPDSAITSIADCVTTMPDPTTAVNTQISPTSLVVPASATSNTVPGPTTDATTQSLNTATSRPDSAITPVSETVTTIPDLTTANTVPATSTASNSSTRREQITKKERELILTMIAMCTSFIICIMPVTIHFMFVLEWHPESCCVFHPDDFGMFVVIGFQFFIHVNHIFFLFFLNTNFRNELKSFLSLVEVTRERDVRMGQM